MKPGRYPRHALTSKQVDALEHVAAGWRADAIGAASGRAGSSVEGVLRNARLFLGAATNADAVAIALGRQLIDPASIANLRLQRRCGAPVEQSRKLAA